MGGRYAQSLGEDDAHPVGRAEAAVFGNVKADVLALKDPSYQRQNFCSIILSSPWPN